MDCHRTRQLHQHQPPRAPAEITANASTHNHPQERGRTQHRQRPMHHPQSRLSRTLGDSRIQPIPSGCHTYDTQAPHKGVTQTPKLDGQLPRQPIPTYASLGASVGVSPTIVLLAHKRTPKHNGVHADRSGLQPSTPTSTTKRGTPSRPQIDQQGHLVLY